MFLLLKVPSEKLKGKLIEDVKQRVTSVSSVLCREVSFEESKDALLAGFQEEFGGNEFVPGLLLTEEATLSQQLKSLKYASDSWNKKR